MELKLNQIQEKIYRPIFYTPVSGTWGWATDASPDLDWWQFGSAFNRYVEARNTIMSRPNNPFRWTTNLNGTWVSKIDWLGKLFNRDKNNRDWDASGWSFKEYQSGVPYYSRATISHSHGFQVVMYACGKYKLTLPLLVTFGAPVRSDLKELYSKAREHIKYWIHIYDPEDAIQWAGLLFDKDISNTPQCDLADLNIPIPSSNHSHLLKNPDFFHLYILRNRAY